MNVLIYLIPMAVGLGLVGLLAFLWALRSGQYSDIEGAALRILSDDDVEPAHDARLEGTYPDGPKSELCARSNALPHS